MNGRRSSSTSALTLNRKRLGNTKNIWVTSVAPTKVWNHGSRSPDICTARTQKNTKLRSIRLTPSRTIQRWIGRTFSRCQSRTRSQRSRRKTSCGQRCFCRRTIRISPATSPSQVCTACTCSAACSCSFTCGCLSARGFTSAIRNTLRIASKSAAFSGTLLIWCGFLCSRFFTCSEHEQSARYFAGSKGIRGIRARHTKARQRLSDGGRAPADLYRYHGGSFLRRFRNAQSQYQHRHAGGDLESGRRRRGFHAFGRGKTAHLSHLDLHRFFCARHVLAYFIGVVRLPNLPVNVA